MINEKTKKSIINIVNKENEGVGTGFFISSHIIATAYHVIEGFQKDIIYNDYNNTKLYAQSFYVNKDQDIALIKTDIASEVWLELVDDNYIFNNTMSFKTYGFATSQKNKVEIESMKYVGEAEIDDIKGYTLENAGMVFHGFSGAPILNDEYKVVGIIKGVVSERTAICFALHINLINDVMNRNNINSIYDQIYNISQQIEYKDLLKTIKEGEQVVPIVGDLVNQFALGGKQNFLKIANETTPNCEENFRGEIALNIKKY